MKKHSINIRVYYEDTDAGGVVYHANYLNFAERGRTEFLRYTGFENSVLQKEQKLMFVVRHADINYLKPCFLDDFLTLQSTIQEMKNTSFVMHQCVYAPKKKAEFVKNHASNPNLQHIEETHDLICDMHVVLVCVDTQTLRPVRLPDNVKKAFVQYAEDRDI